LPLSVSAWENFLATIYDRLPGSGFKTTDLIDHLHKSDELKAALPDELGALDDKKFKQRLGQALAARCNRCYGDDGVHVTKLNFNHGVSTWIVRPA
jgi:hypothetical protein